MYKDIANVLSLPIGFVCGYKFGIIPGVLLAIAIIVVLTYIAYRLDGTEL